VRAFAGDSTMTSEVDIGRQLKGIGEPLSNTTCCARSSRDGRVAPTVRRVTAGRAAEVELDHRRARRLGPAETVVWYGLAGVSYVGLSIFHKFLLNWLIGPLWLVAFVWLGPEVVDRVRRRRADRSVEIWSYAATISGGKYLDAAATTPAWAW